MRHGNKVKHLGRPADQRKALIRSLVTEVLRHGQIRTTKVRDWRRDCLRRRLARPPANASWRWSGRWSGERTD